MDGGVVHPYGEEWESFLEEVGFWQVSPEWTDIPRVAFRKGTNLACVASTCRTKGASPKCGLMVEADGPAVSFHNGFIGEAAAPLPLP